MSLQSILTPTKEDVINGYKNLISRLEKQIYEYKERISELEHE
jgi:hypothetical protein